MPSWHRQRNGTLNLFATLNVATGHATHKKNDGWLERRLAGGASQRDRR
jgi:hypothetical protein